MADLHTHGPIHDDEEGAYRTGWAISAVAVLATVLLLWHFNV